MAIIIKSDKSVKFIKDETSTRIIAAEPPVRIIADTPPVNVVSAIEQGLKGQPGPKGDKGDKGADGAKGEKGDASNANAIWILDVTPTSTGIVAQKTYRPFVATNPLIDTAVSDTYAVRVKVGATGGNESYSPIGLVNGTPIVFTESSTARWFIGYATIILSEGLNIINALIDGDTDTVRVTASTFGPVINSIVFGNYPGTQTSLKQGDTLSVTINTDLAASTIGLQMAGAVNSLVTLNVVNGVATGSFTISGNSGNQKVTAIAKNAMGTAGPAFLSTDLLLDQVYPTFTLNSKTYASGLPAAKINEVVSVDITVLNFNSILYSSSHVTIPLTTMYSKIKDTTVTLSGYNTGNNYTISATRTANNSSATYSSTIKIASISPVASISIVGNPSRLVSSPTGLLYTIIVTPSQTLSTAPTLNASIGTWQGSWTLVGSQWQRGLLIADSDAKGIGLFSGLNLYNEANLLGTTISSGTNYLVGGYSSRIVTFTAFSRVAALGVNVETESKTSAQIVGGNTLVRYSDSLVHSNGYYFANADGSYNAKGAYIGLSDSAFAGSNTSGTLQASTQETL